MKKPTTDLWKVFGALLFSLGILLFLITLHLMVTNTTGNSEAILLTTFELSLKIFIFIVSIAFAFVLIYFFMMLIYLATTPKWLRDEQKEGEHD